MKILLVILKYLRCVQLEVTSSCDKNACIKVCNHQRAWQIGSGRFLRTPVCHVVSPLQVLTPLKSSSKSTYQKVCNSSLLLGHAQTGLWHYAAMLAYNEEKDFLDISMARSKGLMQYLWWWKWRAEKWGLTESSLYITEEVCELSCTPTGREGASFYFVKLGV